MADLKTPTSLPGTTIRLQLEFRLEFKHRSFEQLYIISENSCKPIKDDQVIRVSVGLCFELNTDRN